MLRQIADLPPLGKNTGTDDETIRNRLRVLAAVEDSVGKIFKALEDAKQLDNTLIIFTSDEGYFYGEHGLSVERRLVYEESARIPLLMRYPKLIKKGRAIDEMALNIDIAPTSARTGRRFAPANMDGTSLAPLLKGEKVPWRKSLLIEYFSDKVFPRVSQMGYQAVRTERFKYIHYLNLKGMDELYDLDCDPCEMTNIMRDPKAPTLIRELDAERLRLLKP